MSTEELLKPRYKVIADYPRSYFFIGDILTPDEKIPENSVGAFIDDATGWAWVYHPEKFPVCLRRLHWAEDREPGGMPEYVKTTLNGPESFYKWDEYDFTNDFLIHNGIVPATAAEYADYQLKKQNI